MPVHHLNLVDKTISLKKSGCLQVDNYLKKITETDFSIVTQLFVVCILNQYINPMTKVVEFYKLEHEYKIELSIPKKKEITLEDCIIETFKEDFLHGENAWYDEKENTKKNVLKRCALAYTPTILCLHLKRWKENLSKNNTKIVSPFLLDITRFTIYKDKQLYELFGILNHEGGIKGGHYYSYVLRDKQWFILNDNYVQLISSDAIIHESNYCLFYRKIK
jgi:ubiquitin C-terminal hydrolase